MRIVTRLLLNGLLACGVSFYACVIQFAQQPGTVTVRHRVTATQPGGPEVKVTVDRNSVPAGSEVIFALAPARIVSDSRYRVTLFFGDGRRQVVRQAKISHVYSQSGTYTYSVLVEPEKQSAPTPTPTPVPPVPNVTLSASPTSVEVNRAVNFSAQLSRRHQGLKYRFVFGDGSDTGWQDNAEATHSYRAANTFKAYVDIGVFSNGSVKQAGGSIRESIKVTEPPRPLNASVKPTSDTTTNEVREPAGKFTVDLNVIPATLPLGVPVLLQAVPSAASAKTAYRFNFGDGSAPTSWSSDPLQTHIYSAAGNYSAFVEMAISGREPKASGKKRVRVIPIGPISNTNGNRNANTGNNANSNSTPRSNTNGGANSIRNATVTGSTNSNGNSNANSQVNANTDSAANVNSNINANANSSSSGSRNANRNANSTGATNTNARALNASASPAASQNPQPAATGESTGWWKYLIIAAIILFAAYQAYSYFFAPRPTFVPHVDPGDSEVGAGKPLSIDLQVDVDPNIRDGKLTVDTQGKSLIESKRIEP